MAPSWSECTYWALTRDKGLVTLEAISIDDPSVVADLKDAKIIIVPVKGFSPCHECPHLEACMNSQWAEGRLGGPTDVSRVSAVSVCEVCGESILSITGDISKPISSQCPRQIVSGQDCTVCALQRRVWELN